MLGRGRCGETSRFNAFVYFLYRYLFSLFSSTSLALVMAPTPYKDDPSYCAMGTSVPLDSNQYAAVPATAPEMIDIAVATKTTWKKKSERAE